MGGSYPPHDDETLIDGQWYWGEGFNEESHPGLKVFFCHSDCDGELTPDECEMIANEMEALLPAIEQQGEGGGHIASRGGYKGVAESFIAGCRDAANAGEVLEFH